MFMLSPLVQDSDNANGVSTRTSSNEKLGTRSDAGNSEEIRTRNRALFLKPIPPEGNFAIKTMRGAVKLGNAGIQSGCQLFNLTLQSGINKLKIICDENKNDPKTQRTREIGLWALAGIAALTTISTAITTISKLKDNDRNRPNILMSIAQIFTGLTLSRGIVNTLKGKDGASFNNIKSIMLGTGVYATISFLNSLVKSDGMFSRALKPFGITDGVHDFLGPMDATNLGDITTNMPMGAPAHSNN